MLNSTVNYNNCLLRVSTPDRGDEVGEVYMHINSVRSSVLEHAEVQDGVWVKIFEITDKSYLIGSAEDIAEEVMNTETPDLDKVIGSTKEVVPV